MFKIGDFVVGKKEYASVYSATSYRKKFVGKVLDRNGSGKEIRVEIIESTAPKEIGMAFWVDSIFFEAHKNNQVTLKRLGVIKND